MGWARRASTGLVGIARHDGEEGAKKVIEYLQDKPDSGELSADALVAALQAKGATPVTKQDLEILAASKNSRRGSATWRHSNIPTTTPCCRPSKASAKRLSVR